MNVKEFLTINKSKQLSFIWYLNPNIPFNHTTYMVLCLEQFNPNEEIENAIRSLIAGPSEININSNGIYSKYGQNNIYNDLNPKGIDSIKSNILNALIYEQFDDIIDNEQTLVIGANYTGENPTNGHTFEISGYLLSKTRITQYCFYYIIKQKDYISVDEPILKKIDITPERLYEGKDINSIKQKVQFYLNRHKTVAYNQPITFQAFQSLGFEIRNKGIDPMNIMTNIINTEKKSVSFQECLDYLKIGYSDNQTYQSDEIAKLTCSIILKLIDRGEYK